MVTIKVYHQTQKNTFLRFVVSNKITWPELETKIRSLFTIPVSTPFILSYVDEDNDVITLSTDIELHEVLSSKEPTSTIKFNLKISAPDNLSDSEDSNNEAWVFEGLKTPPQGTASVVVVGADNPDNNDNNDNDDNDDNVPQKNITSTTNQEAQSVESDSEEVVPSNKKLLLDDDLYEEGSSSTKGNTMNEFYKSFDALSFVPTITPLNEDKGKRKEAIGESSSINVSSSLFSSYSSFLEQNQQSPQENQSNQPPQEDQNDPSPPSTSQDQSNQPALSVYELADNFQKLIDQFKKDAVNNPKYAQDSLSILHQLIRSISAQLPPPQEDDQSHQQELRGQRYNVQQNHSQSRKNNDDFFDNPPPLFTRQPPIPGSFPTPPKSVPCPWAGQARPDSESYEPHNHTRNGRRRRRRHRRHNHNRDYDEPKEETQETQETQEEREEILETQERVREEILEARERMREEMQEARERAQEARERAQEVRERAQEVRERAQEIREGREGREEARELRREIRGLRQTTEPSPYQEQIDQLNDMGFWPDEDQYVELLTMYEGSIDQVIECLLERQSRSQ